MLEVISITIPNHPAMLRLVGEALQEMAKDKSHFSSLPSLPVTGGARETSPYVEEIKDILADAPVVVPPPPGTIASEFAIDPAVVSVPAPPAETIIPQPQGQTPPAPGMVNEVAPKPVLAARASGPLDSAGMPHDERIHAKTQTKTADGKWKYKRNIDATLKAQVEAELKSALPAFDAIPAQGVEAPPVTGAVTVPAPPAAGTIAVFQDLMNWLTTVKPAFEPAQLDAACLSVGVQGGIMALAAAATSNPALLAQVQTYLGALK